MHITLEQLSDATDAVLHGSAQPIEFGDQEHIPGPAGIDGPLQLDPFAEGCSTGDVFTEQLIHQGRLEALELMLELLGRCGATRITNERHGASCRMWMSIA